MMLILVPATLQGDVLGQDGDAALAFQIVGVEDARAAPAAQLLAELPGLLEHLVDQRRLAVVDVGDDGHISQIISLHAASFKKLRPGMHRASWQPHREAIL